jgi:ectoine hydroxylase-related dioxygenase (phytanoyl-CoA dioxygenase family)
MAQTETRLQMPTFTGDYDVRPDQTRKYLNEGHILLRDVISRDEAETARQIIADVSARFNKERKALADRDTYHKAFLQTGNLWEKDEEVKKFVLARRFARIAAKLMDVDGVRLYHDQALFKEPGGGHTPWHQDQYYWPLDTRKTITMWMPLVDAPCELGTLVFASGSHIDGPLAQMHISDDSEAYFRRLVMEKEYPLTINEMRAGDATFHSGWTLHKAPGNSTNKMRAAMTIIYYADGTRVHEPRNQHQPADLQVFLDSKKPGELADGPLNPLLWHKDWEK